VRCARITYTNGPLTFAGVLLLRTAVLARCDNAFAARTGSVTPVCNGPACWARISMARICGGHRSRCGASTAAACMSADVRAMPRLEHSESATPKSASPRCAALVKAGCVPPGAPESPALPKKTGTVWMDASIYELSAKTIGWARYASSAIVADGKELAPYFQVLI
jgi:hypothetical protein